MNNVQDFKQNQQLIPSRLWVMEDVIQGLTIAQTKKQSLQDEPEQISHSQLHEHEDYVPSSSP